MFKERTAKVLNLPASFPPTLPRAGSRGLAALMIAKLAKHFSPCPTACVILVLCACLALAACAPARWYDTARPLLDTFSDQQDTAASTARIGLAPVILEMQATVREVEAIQTTSAAHTRLVIAMRLTVAYYQAFAANQSDAAVSSARAAAETAWAEATRLIQAEAAQ